uniref:Uncharacterized protein n=1 Tax=Arundo donax TaxID=35708 RepID=A0A0A9FGZ3_ARUDO
MRFVMFGVHRRNMSSSNLRCCTTCWRISSSLTPRHQAMFRCLRQGNEVDSNNTRLPREARLSRRGRALSHRHWNSQWSTTSSLIAELGASTTTGKVMPPPQEMRCSVCSCGQEVKTPS